MIRLTVVVEGSTEREFVNRVLVPHLRAHQVDAKASIVGKEIRAQRRGFGRGAGGGHFKIWRRDLEHLLRNDRGADRRITTLFDLYGLPGDFPGLDLHRTDLDTNRRCDALQAALGHEIGDPRFIPYLQRHEFEALVLASISALRELFDANDDVAGLMRLEASIRGFAPEDINDGYATAPSKRLVAHVPGYRKSLHGPDAAADTGLATLRERCPRFSAWVTRLETLNESAIP